LSSLDLRHALNNLEQAGELIHINYPLSPKYEIAAALKVLDHGPAAIFEKVKEFDFKVAGGLCNSRNKLSLTIGVPSSRLHDSLLEAIEKPSPPVEVEDAPVNDVEELSLYRLPILTHYEGDAGPYITSGIIIAKDPEEHFQNASFHRMLIKDEKTLVVRVVPRHLHHIMVKAEKAGKPLPVAIIIGAHPAVLLAAASSPPLGVDELHVANSLMKNNLKVTRCTHADILVPADAEFLLEGYLYPNVLSDEGPFVDITGTYDIVRKQPVIRISKIFRREDAIYQAILPASCEHRLLMGFHREALIRKFVSQVVPEVKDVKLSFGGCGWLHAIISIRKTCEGDAKNAILAAFAAHPSLKHVIVVDEDINVDDIHDVEWAIATRFQADEDLIVIRNVRGSSIDPSADQERLLTSKMGIDATKPMNKPTQHFQKASIPKLSEVKKLLEDLKVVPN